ncbi:MAG: methyltransferase, partial [bacterium]|nr:methyltransferase [bacterium]
DNLVGPDRVKPVEAAVFAVNMLAGTTRGRTYTADEISAWLKTAGFDPEPAEQVAPRTWVLQAGG